MSYSQHIALVFVLLLGGSLSAQTQDTNAPDCSIKLGPLTAAGVSPNWDNRPNSANQGQPCTEWIFIASAISTNISFSMQMETAQDNGVAGCVGCSFSLFGTALTAEGSTLKSGYGDYIRLHLTAISGGTVQGMLNGWRENANAIKGGGGGGGGGSMVSFSTHSLSFGPQRQQFAGSPYPQSITVSGTGTIAVSSITGTPFNFQSAITVRICQQTGTSQCIPKTTAPATIWVSWNGYGNNNLPPATYTGAINLTSSTGCVTSCSIAVALTVASYTSPTFTPSSPSGCARSNSMYYDLDTCSPTKAPGSISVVAQGSTWTDDFFSTTNTVIISPATSGIRVFPTDSTVSAINSDNSLVMTAKTNSQTFASNTSAGGDTWSSIPIGDGSVLSCWDATDPLTYYYTLGVRLHKVVLVTPPSTVTDTVIYTYPGSATKITTGSGAACSKDNWMDLFTIGGDQVIILINLSSPSSVFTLPFGGLVMADFVPRAIQLSVGKNTPDGLRYLFFTGGGGFTQTATDVVFTFDGSTIKFDYFLPQNPDAQRLPHPSFGVPCDSFAEQQGTANAFSNCYLAPHANMIEVSGIQYYVYEGGIQDPYFQGATIGRLDKGLLFGTAAEAGGGAYFPYPMTISDLHFSSARSAPLVLVEEDGHNVLTAYSVTNLTIGANPTVTSSPAYPGTNGDTVAFAGLTGVGGMVTCTVATLSGSTFVANGCTSTGSYTAGTGAFTKATAPTPGPHMDEIDILDLTNIAGGTFAVTRLASSRDHEFTGGHLDNVYYGGNHGVLSADGKLACWQFNNNLPDNVGIACAPTGF